MDQATSIIQYITGDGLALVLNNVSGLGFFYQSYQLYKEYRLQALIIYSPQTSTETFKAIAGYIDNFIEDLADGVSSYNNYTDIVYTVTVVKCLFPDTVGQ